VAVTCEQFAAVDEVLDSLCLSISGDALPLTTS
jgi:hypothetical protein